MPAPPDSLLPDQLNYRNRPLRGRVKPPPKQDPFHKHPPSQLFVSHQVHVLSGLFSIRFQEINNRRCHPSLNSSAHSPIYTITKGLFESKVNPRYRKSDVGICSSIDSINVTIRRSTSASP